MAQPRDGQERLASGHGDHGRRWPDRRIRIGGLLALALSALLLMSSGCARQAAAPARGPLPAVAPAGRLQEVTPPGAVVQITAALANRRPRLRITTPAEGSLVPAGPWRLGLALEDWPLATDPDLGVGAHLVVQVDDGPGLRIGDWTQGDPDTGRLELAMAPLTPGSHRITAYAALPWGEAVKLPGASSQRLVHRVAANPLSQPAAGSAQLLAVSTDGLSSAEPVLIDWLLRDAPLQGLRDGDARWRLRISVNGESFLVNQNTPLWLRGLKPGSNALLLELLDGLGEPLNPPFNSRVQEVVIQPGPPRPVWLNDRISPADLARLLGEAASPPSEQPASTQPPGDTAPNPPLELSAPAEPSPATAMADTEEPPPRSPDPATGPPLAQGAEPEPELIPAPTERVEPTSSLSGSARAQVREDGSLIQPGRP